MNETIKIIVSTLSATIPLLGAFLTLIIRFARSEKARKLAKDLNFFTEKASELVKIAEEFTNYKGVEKKEYVLTKINQACIENKIKFNVEKVSNIIEEIVKITKSVNKREKDKERELV